MSVLSPHFHKAVSAFYDGLNTDQQRLLKFLRRALRRHLNLLTYPNG